MKLIHILKIHKIDSIILALLILLYAIPLIVTITWGIPNPTHPFLYHMDEWHQFMSVKAVFKQLSNNVPGAAHGPMWQFILTGIYLIPFYLFRIINPFILKSSLDSLSMQEKIFIVLRLNTILFGGGSIIGIYIIAKKYLRTNPVVTSLLFLATPVWIMLSGYFKYDIALVFWIICSLVFLFNYHDQPTRKNFIIACGICALALATKISALPIIPIYIVAFILFTPKLRQNVSWLLWGTALFIGIFCVTGIPDLFLQKGDYREFLYSNLVSGPQTTQNIKLNTNEFIYLFFRHYPVIFGHAFFLLIIASACIGSMSLISIFHVKKTNILKKYNREIFLFSSFILFLLSIVPLKMTATGNRSLVLLPFFTLLCSLALKKSEQQLASYKLFINILIGAIIALQLFETVAWVTIKISPDPRLVSSIWIKKHISPNSQIGLENVPIYQMIPDSILNDYYKGIFNPQTKTIYKYRVIDASSKQLPTYVIITGADYDTKYLKISSKKELVNRLNHAGYKRIAAFYPNLKLYYLFNNELNYYLSALIPANPIAIYEKNMLK